MASPSPFDPPPLLVAAMVAAMGGRRRLLLAGSIAAPAMGGRRKGGGRRAGGWHAELDFHVEHALVPLEELKEFTWRHQLCQASPNFPWESVSIMPYTWRETLL